MATHPSKIPIPSDLDRMKFQANVTAYGDNDCWDWVGRKDRDGYGQFQIQGKIRFAHRVSYFISTGIDPEELCCLHHCDRPSCVNPGHLFLGSHKDNAADKVSKGRQLMWDKNPSAKISRDDVIRIREIYKSGGVLQRDLATQFRLSKSQISRIIRNEKWKFALITQETTKTNQNENNKRSI